MATKSLYIQGGRIIDPSQGIDFSGNLLIEKGKITWLGEEDKTPPAGSDVISAKGMTVTPGFVDLHCHLREPGYEDKETIATGTLAAARGGFTTVCCMPNTRPPLDSEAVLKQVMDEAAANGAVRMLPIACITENRSGEKIAPLAELASARAVAFSDDGDCVMDTAVMLEAMRRAKELGLLLSQHSEHKALVRGGVMNAGKVAVELGLKGMPAAAEEIMIARDVALCRLTGARLHVAHVSTAGSVGIIRRAKADGLPVTAEVTPHHLTLTEEMVRGYDTDAKVNPPLRTAEDVKALIDGLNEGVIDAIATDHAPHTSAEKAAGFMEAPFGISVFETALGSLMGLVHRGQVTLETLISRLACGPAAILGDRYGKFGTLEVGVSGDVVIFDPDKDWTVDPKRFVSKGRNTPLAGKTLKGKVMATVYGGEIVFKDKSVKVKEQTVSV